MLTLNPNANPSLLNANHDTKVVSILPLIFWRHQIGRSYCAPSLTQFELNGQFVMQLVTSVLLIV